MAQYDIGIDLGTTTIIIAMEGKGVILNQPSVVAVDTRKDQVLAVGDDALAMVGRTPNYILATRPLKDGVISNHTLTKELICRFVNKVYDSKLIKPRVAVCVPAAITGIESDAVVEAVVAAGARQVFLIDEPIAAALGCGIDILQPEGHMVVDIGGGTTDIAVISLGGKVRSTSVKIAGNTFDDEIQKYARIKFNVAIGLRTAEELKKKVACCRPCEFSAEMEVKGRSRPAPASHGDHGRYVRRGHAAGRTDRGGGSSGAGTHSAGAGWRHLLLRCCAHGRRFHAQRTGRISEPAAQSEGARVALGTAKCLEIGDQLESGFVDATPRLGHR